MIKKISRLEKKEEDFEWGLSRREKNMLNDLPEEKGVKDCQEMGK